METHTEQLPKSDAPTLVLRNPTREEQQATWTLNGQAWRGPMSIDSYIRRERHLLSQDLLRDGGITFWILVDKSAPPNHRPILASCESIRKRALITREAGQVEEVTSHGICSVFCNPKFRGKGYAQRMIKELAKKLDTWQQEDGRRADFTVLFSDIGTVGSWLGNCHAKDVQRLTLAPEFLLQDGLEGLPIKPCFIAT